jgi:hypothetical protein
MLAFATTTLGQSDTFLERLMYKKPEQFGTILSNPQQFEVQILYTQIDRNAKGVPKFTTYGYRSNPREYFYPASTVKLPAVLLALEKLNRLNISGVNKYTPMLTEAERPSQTAVSADTTAEDGLPSVAHYSRKILLVSDNDAFNRLYEFIGQEEFNEAMKAKGFLNTRITHRLESALSLEENRYTNPIRFEKEGVVLHRQAGAYSPQTYTSPEPIRKGKGFMRGGKLVEEPFDFTEKNAFALADQHQLLRALFFPESVPAERRFNLTEDDYRFVYQYMSQLPIETSYPEDYGEKYYDSYCKFFIYGDSQRRMPRHIRIFNKVGDAYGYLLDNAYIVDFERGIEFMLTAVIHCNQNGIFNDDTYEYETVGFPFMANLGKLIFEHELQRKRRKERPDLNRFEISYDK